MAHGDAREGNWRGNWRMEWIANTLHTTSEHGVSSITTADAHTSASSSRLNWRPRRFKWTRPFRRKTSSAYCACAITLQTPVYHVLLEHLSLLTPLHCNMPEDEESFFPSYFAVYVKHVPPFPHLSNPNCPPSYHPQSCVKYYEVPNLIL